MSEDDLSLLRRQWPVSVIQSMTWMQSELDDMRASAKKRYRHSWPGACTYCGKYTKCDMYRHVSNYHLDLGQLWRCHGARYGKARHKIVWTMSGEHTMSPWTLNPPA